MNKLAVIVTTAPTNHLTETAIQLIYNAVEQGIDVIGVFFYQAGVLNASKQLIIPSDEFPLHQRWCSLNKNANVPLYLCSTAAEKHGLIHDNANINLELISDAFTIAGLGELVTLHSKADRLVQL